MGGKNDKRINYEIPLNKELNNHITNVIVKKDLEKLNRLIHKNVKSNIKTSNFNKHFKGDDNGHSNILSLINLIYTKSTNNFLKTKGNRTIYETLFNYDIVEKKGKGYEQFKKNIANTIRLFISGEKNNNINNEKLLNNIINEENANNINNDENDNNINNNNVNNNNVNNNNVNNNNENNGIFETLNDLSIKNENNSLISEKKEILKSQNPHNNTLNNQNSFINSLNSNNNSNNNTNNTNIHYSGILTEPSFKNINNKETENNILNKRTTTLGENNEKSNTINSNNKKIKISKYGKSARSTSKTKHKKNPNKKPLVNIKVDLRLLYKEDVITKEIESERKRYRSPPNSFLKTRQSNFNNENQNEESFISKIDRYTQPNKLEKDIIHYELNENNPKKMFQGCTSNKNISYKMNATKKNNKY